jgi:tetratricopeptide (TPR) repeat protein
VNYAVLVAAAPANPEYQLRRAQCQNEFAWMLTSAGRPADAEREHREALALLEKLVGEFPHEDNYRMETGHTLWWVANLAAAAGRPAEAEQDHRRALATFQKLAAEFPHNRYYQLEQGNSDWILAGFLRQQNRLPEAGKSYQDAANVYANMLAEVPDDGLPRIRLPQIQFELAEALRTNQRLDEAEKHYRLAEAAWRKLAADNPTEPSYRIQVISTCTYQLGPLLAERGHTHEAEEVYRTTAELLTSLPLNELVAENRRNLTDTCYGNLVRLFKNGKRSDEAKAVIRAWLDVRGKTLANILEMKPKSAAEYENLGNALVQSGRWDEALAAIDKAAELEPDNHWYLFLAASVHLRAGDIAGYRRVCRGMLERFQESRVPEVVDRTAKTCLLLPNAVPDFAGVQKLADRDVTGTEKNGGYRWFVFDKGLAEYRAGRSAEAVKWLERFGPNADGVHIDASGFAVLAMAEHRLGQPEKARAALHSGQAIVAEKMPDPAAGRPFDGMWQDWLHCQILLREAEALLKPPQQKGDKPAK